MPADFRARAKCVAVGVTACGIKRGIKNRVLLVLIQLLEVVNGGSSSGGVLLLNDSAQQNLKLPVKSARGAADRDAIAEIGEVVVQVHLCQGRLKPQPRGNAWTCCPLARRGLNVQDSHTF